MAAILCKGGAAKVEETKRFVNRWQGTNSSAIHFWRN